jgi:hypothetical protein
MPTYEPGDYVKVEFPDEITGIGEWMWVRLDYCDDESRVVFGTLDNEPLNDYDGKISLGSELAISYDNIRDHKSRLSDQLLDLLCRRSGPLGGRHRNPHGDVRILALRHLLVPVIAPGEGGEQQNQRHLTVLDEEARRIMRVLDDLGFRSVGHASSSTVQGMIRT